MPTRTWKCSKLGLTLAKTLYDDTAAKIRAGKLASIDIYQPESEVAQEGRRSDLPENGLSVSLNQT
jgi:hypothetical protein